LNEVCSALELPKLKTTGVAVPAVSDGEDYGYNETAASAIQCGIVETEASSYNPIWLIQTVLWE